MKLKSWTILVILGLISLVSTTSSCSKQGNTNNTDNPNQEDSGFVYKIGPGHLKNKDFAKEFIGMWTTKTTGIDPQAATVLRVFKIDQEKNAASFCQVSSLPQEDNTLLINVENSLQGNYSFDNDQMIVPSEVRIVENESLSTFYVLTKRSGEKGLDYVLYEKVSQGSDVQQDAVIERDHGVLYSASEEESTMMANAGCTGF